MAGPPEESQNTAAILPGIIALAVMGAWVLWPQRRDVEVEIVGVPSWGFFDVELGNQYPDDVRTGGIAAKIFSFDDVVVRTHTLRINGGVGEPDECVRCCWALDNSLKVPRGQGTVRAEMLASTPRCPTDEVAYRFQLLEPGGTSVGGIPAQARHAFWIGETEVTQALWSAVMGAGGCPDAEPLEPVGCVDWRAALAFTNRLSRMEGLEPVYFLDSEHQTLYTGEPDGEIHWRRQANGYRLPTEAEWTYAARAGAADAPPKPELLCRLANARGDEAGCDDRFPNAAPVGSFLPNPWELYDTMGNVAEWTWDAYADEYNRADHHAGPLTKTRRVVRGGSWQTPAGTQSVQERIGQAAAHAAPDVGLRIARTQPSRITD
ncbi:MAG: SUMF1/EgtB/PvdO family nonheme iron enzyme [Myxococcota bacterium]